ncbi:MAG: glycoside hydrolase family 15 protein [Armatimonadota bacterium]
MPRPYTFANGNMLVAEDSRLNIRDLTYPHVGQLNHLAGNRVRMGVWADGQFDWLDDPVWQITGTNEEDAPISRVKAVHSDLAIELRLHDTLCRTENIWLRHVEVQNRTDSPREIRLFMSYDFNISESDIGDTVFYDPNTHSIVHYKREVWMLGSGDFGHQPPFGYCCGTKRWAGSEGTWRDCEDGELGGNAIEQGSVDSSLGWRAEMGPDDERVARLWIAAGGSHHEVQSLHRTIFERGFDRLFEETRHLWKGWVAQAKLPNHEACGALDPLLHQSIIQMRNQIDNGGAILAANDSDIMATARAHYSYMWPRDGAIVADTLSQLGYAQIAERFFEFCGRILPHEPHFLLQKYCPDGSMGASWHPFIENGHSQLPVQEDGSALVAWALCRHIRRHSVTTEGAMLVESLLLPIANSLRSYVDPNTGLPKPSYDLWEERRGAHIWSCCCIVAALYEVGQLLEMMQQPHAILFQKSAEDIRQATIKHFWMEDEGAFARMITTSADGVMTVDRTLDSSQLAAILYGLIPADDPRAVRMVACLEKTLLVKSPIGGLARYEDDYYHRVSLDLPGNPWVICSLWLARAKAMMSTSSKQITESKRWLYWACERQLEGGALPEQVNPFTGEAIYVAPLTWSHAEFCLAWLKLAGK